MEIPIEKCPVEEAIRIIGGKWKLLVLRSLLLNGPQRTRNLRELTSTGLVARAAGSGIMVQYNLTELGNGLMPTFEALLIWGKNLAAAG